MTNHKSIEELQSLKALINQGTYNEEILNRINELLVSPEDIKENDDIIMAIHGIGSLENINNTLSHLEPYTLEHNNGFKRAQAPWITLYTISRKNDEPISLAVKPAKEMPNHHQKTAIIQMKNQNNYMNEAA